MSSLKPFLPCTALISFSCQRAMQTACTDWRPMEFFPYIQSRCVPASYHLPSTHLSLSLPCLPSCQPSYLVPLWKPTECVELCLQCRKVACVQRKTRLSPPQKPSYLPPFPPPCSSEITLINLRLIFIFISYFSQIFVQRGNLRHFSGIYERCL